MIRILLVDDHPVVRSGLKTLLGNVDDCEVCGEASNGMEAIESVATETRSRPDGHFHADNERSSGHEDNSERFPRYENRSAHDARFCSDRRRSQGRRSKRISDKVVPFRRTPKHDYGRLRESKMSARDVFSFGILARLVRLRA